MRIMIATIQSTPVLGIPLGLIEVSKQRIELIRQVVLKRGKGELEGERPEEDESVVAREVEDAGEEVAENRFVGGLRLIEDDAGPAAAARVDLHLVQELAHVRRCGVFQVRAELFPYR